LLSLYQEDGLTQAQLCERVRIEQPTMANTLARMERDGLIDRLPDPVDGRRSLVTLTKRARDVEGDLTVAARRVNAAATRGLTKSQISTFMQTMDAIIGNLERAATTPSSKDATSCKRPTPSRRGPLRQRLCLQAVDWSRRPSSSRTGGR